MKNYIEIYKRNRNYQNKEPDHKSKNDRWKGVIMIGAIENAYGKLVKNLIELEHPKNNLNFNKEPYIVKICKTYQ